MLIERVAVNAFNRDWSTRTSAHRFNDVDIGVKIRNVGKDNVTLRTVFKRGTNQFRYGEGERVGN